MAKKKQRCHGTTWGNGRCHRKRGLTVERDGYPYCWQHREQPERIALGLPSQKLWWEDESTL